MFHVIARSPKVTGSSGSQHLMTLDAKRDASRVTQPQQQAQCLLENVDIVLVGLRSRGEKGLLM